MTNRFSLSLAAAMLATGPTFAAGSTSGGPAPAQVANPTTEAQLTTVTLTAKAQERLGIVTAPVERKPIERTRRLGGTVVLPLTLTSATPGSGTVQFAPDPPTTTAEVLRLTEMQTVADGDIVRASVQLEASQIAWDRAKTLLQTGSGSQRAVDEARAVVQLATTALEQARLRRSLLGAPVSETADLGRVWIKVPVYVGDLSLLDPAREIQVGGLTDRAGAAMHPARLAAGPPSANAGAATVDWFYEMANPQPKLRLGQRVGVQVPLRGEEQSLVVPWAAVLHDLHGGQWVYEMTAPHTFVRRRVEVARVLGRDALLVAGPMPGTPVVTDGAAELFGTEFGAGK